MKFGVCELQSEMDLPFCYDDERDAKVHFAASCSSHPHPVRCYVHIFPADHALPGRFSDNDVTQSYGLFRKN